MRREIFAGVLLLLILAGSIMNSKYAGGQIDDLLETLDESKQLAEIGSYAEAEELVASALEHWESLSVYTHIMIRHSSVDDVTNCLYDLMSFLGSADGGALRGAYSKAESCLKGIMEIERVTLQSVF